MHTPSAIAKPSSYLQRLLLRHIDRGFCVFTSDLDPSNEGRGSLPHLPLDLRPTIDQELTRQSQGFSLLAGRQLRNAVLRLPRVLDRKLPDLREHS